MKKKRIIAFSVILIVVAIVSGIVICIIKNDVPNDIGKNNEIPTVTTNGKLQDYIANLTDNYYIKYHGKFKNNSGDLVNAIIEYTKDGEKCAFRSTELDMHLVCDKDKLYSISHRYELIVSMNKQNLDVREYNLASDIGQVFVKSYKENVDKKEFDVEEYLFNGNTLKYYFKDSDIKLIKYNGEDIKIIRVEKQTNSEMLVKPDWYKIKQS